MDRVDVVEREVDLFVVVVEGGLGLGQQKGGVRQGAEVSSKGRGGGSGKS